MTSRLQTIKETVSDTADIVKGLCNPEFQDSLEKVRETAAQSKEIIALLQTPEMQGNIVNITHAAESFQSAASSLESIVKEFKSTGVGNDISAISKLVKDGIEAIRILQTNKEAMVELNATVRSLGQLFDELKFAVRDSRKTGMIGNFRDAATDVAETVNIGVGGR